jgi:catechol 2,3-dioxygenase-like lactoylglutathione lyase family enzyme
MIAGGNATIYVSDLGRSLRFYIETLGFKLVERFGDEWASVDAGDGLVLGLHPAREGGPKPGALGSIQVGFNATTPIAEVVMVLENRGVVFRGPIKDDGVKLAFFSDPDGNALYIVEPHSGSK